MPGPLFMDEAQASGIDSTKGMSRSIGERLAASYANLLITNKQIIMPLLDQKYDDQVMRQLGTIFPDYQITGIPALEILLGGGNIHCITQQIPAIN